jgi:glycerol-3-phosphate dehydrogenase
MTNKHLSASDRAETVEKLKSETFELIIIGGGITGAGIALDAASRGIKTALVEMQDYAAGTSSRSTKLVHGGLRYLEHLELGLVREVGREREIVHTNAAHIVIPEKMILPIIEDGSLGEFTTSLALYVYDFLAGVKKDEHRKMLSKEETLEKVPLLNKGILKSGALYYEYKTNDSRLTTEVLKKAREFDATLINYTKAEEFLYEDEKVKGIKVKDIKTGEAYLIKGENTVNATGPWTDELRKKDNSLEGKHLRHSKGIHIVVSKEDFNLNHAIYFDTGDNRMVFAIPRFDIVYIGTTDTNYSGNLENPDINSEDVNYLLKAVNRIAPDVNLTPEKVKSAWAGLRPLIHEEGKDPSELSRKDEIFHSDTGLISIAGGKLTGYRIMAKDVTNIVMKRLSKNSEREKIKCQTKNMRLSGGEFPFYPETEKIEELYAKKYDEVMHTKISAGDFRKLFFRYGMNIDRLIDKAFEYYNETKNSESAWLKAEVWYCIFFEGACSLSDFFIRRTGLIFFEIDKIAPNIQEAAGYFIEFLNLSEERLTEDIEELEAELAHAQNFKK